MRLWIFKVTTCLRCSILISILLVIYLLQTNFSRAGLYGILNIVTVEIPETIDDLRLKNYQTLENFGERQREFEENKLKIFLFKRQKIPARLHPNGSIYVLLRSSLIDVNHLSSIRLRRYVNIHFVHFTEEEIYDGTSLSRSKEISRRRFIEYFSISHTSDLIRTALLYKYGGVYFDLDVIPLKSFENFLNVVAIESNDGVNVAAMAFQRGHIVLNIQMEIQLESLEKRFTGLCWNCLGPVALTEALKTVCDQHRLNVQAKEKCQEIDIRPSFTFYPIDYQNIPKFFQRSNSFSTLNFLKNSSVYSIHYFHHMTLNLPIEPMSPFAQLAQISCPNVYGELVDQQ